MAAKVDILSDKLPEADTPLFVTTEENEGTQRTQRFLRKRFRSFLRERASHRLAPTTI